MLYQLSYAHHIAFACTKLPIGAPGRTRTCDHPLRRRMLYPAELRALINLHSVRSANQKLDQKTWAFRPSNPAAAVLDKRGESYRGPTPASTPITKKISEIKGLRIIRSRCTLPAGYGMRECASFSTSADD